MVRFSLRFRGVVIALACILIAYGISVRSSCSSDGEGLLSATTTRRRMSGDGCPYSYLRGTWPVSFDALGLKRSVGHYLDFWSATFGLTLFPVGYLFHSLTNRHVCR
jgi:hypothetical protein